MSATALVGGAIQLVGMGIGFASHQKMVKEQTDVSKKAENVRKQQMMLDGMRRKRAAVREGLINRSLALTNATNQGASGSGPQAGMGAAVAGMGEGQQVVNSASILGSRMFDINQKYFEVSQGGQLWTGVGEGLSSIGGTVLGNAGSINALMGRPAGSSGNSNPNGGPWRGW
jgi:hypothetical protein